jgi:hypothetical protein
MAWRRPADGVRAPWSSQAWMRALQRRRSVEEEAGANSLEVTSLVCAEALVGADMASVTSVPVQITRGIPLRETIETSRNGEESSNLR